MSVLSVYRQLTTEDREAMKNAARKFAADYNLAGIDPNGDGIMDDITVATQDPNHPGQARLRRIWAGRLCRAVGMPVTVKVGIMSGSIGRWVE